MSYIHIHIIGHGSSLVYICSVQTENISTTIVLEFGADIDGPQRMNHTNIGDSSSSPAMWLILSLKCLHNY